MAISTFPAAGGEGSQLQAYKGLAGSNSVTIPAGFYLISTTQVDAFPITVGSQQIQNNTTVLVLETEATTLEFSQEFEDFESVVLPGSPNTIRGGAFGNLTYVAVGWDDSNEAYIASSTDGQTWSLRSLPGTPGRLWNATFGDGLFVVGGSSYLATSTDGITWTERTIPIGGNIIGLTHGNGLFVAGSVQSGDVITSPDGITWTSRTLPNTGSVSDLSFGDGLYLAVDDNNGYLATSADAVTWTQQTVSGAPGRFSGVTFGNSLYVVVGGDFPVPFLATSPDGITWTQRTVPQDTFFTGIFFGNGQFVAVAGDDTLAVSSDGTNWTLVGTVGYTGNLENGFFGDGLYLAGGNTGFLGTSNGVPTAPQFLVLEPTQLNDLT